MTCRESGELDNIAQDWRGECPTNRKDSNPHWPGEKDDRDSGAVSNRRENWGKKVGKSPRGKGKKLGSSDSR